MSENNIMDNGIQFAGFVTNSSSPNIIKVIGVGGGGGNAVDHMYREGIHDVSYVVCNTDRKALEKSPVPNKLQLGKDGLGAGNRPAKGREEAENSIDDIRNMLSDSTKMVFITAGMGGGTGTGAAPVIARCAKEMGILTIAIVTIPFMFEGNKKIDQALDGVEEIYKHVDAMLVINNERLREIYPELSFLNAYSCANDTLTIAAKGIAEIITMRGIMNLDFRDVTTTLQDSGVALMSTGYGEGENRLTKAIREAINSPLLNNNDIFNSQRLLISINFSSQDETTALSMEEINEVHDFMKKFGSDMDTKFGIAVDDTLGEKIKVTILASGFGLHDVPGMAEKMEKKDEEADELEEEKAIRRSNFYGKEKDKPVRARRYIYLFSPSDLDNDDIISMVEATPTYKRTKEELNEIHKKVSNVEAAPAENTEASSQIIF
ncbi:MAG: cell division protein FtsZ [Bacteroidaceae bacterium]|nr:cell division protein FtsZ [Bacteroidaceae bacterium]